MSAENEITEIVSRYTRAADWRDGEALAKLYEADAVVEIHYRGSDGTELLGTLSGGAQIVAAIATWTSYTTPLRLLITLRPVPRRPHGGLRRGAAEADLSRSGAVRRSPAGRHPAAMRLGLLRHPPLPVDPGDDSRRRYGP